MSEPMAAEIWIGGTLPARLVPALCDVIQHQSVSRDWSGWSDGMFCPRSADELQQAVKPNPSGVPLLWLCDSEARWGEFPELESFLQEHQIAYSRRTEGRFDTLPETVEFRPPDFVHVLLTDTQQRPVVAAADLQEGATLLTEALARLDGGQPGVAKTALERALHALREQLPPEIPPLEAFQIDTARP